MRACVCVCVLLGGDSGSRRAQRLNIGCWNMCTLVDSEGSIATAISRKGGRGVTVDRKVSLMVQELKKYGMNVVGISETKWFGNAVYDVDGYLMLHSGRRVPDSGDRVERNEGVGIVLDQALADRWKSGGEEWKPVSSRIVTARLQLCDRAVGGRRQGPVYGSIVRCMLPLIELARRTRTGSSQTYRVCLMASVEVMC